MGICLDTEQQRSSAARQAEESGRGPREAWTYDGPPRTPEPEGRASPLHNGAHVKFEVPKVPVIFVLGGPGSGKVTHCDTLMQEKRGITHINMTDLLQQYAIGNDMKDFGHLSSKTVTEVLMLEMKMAPAAKTYLVSGYPRSMRDVVEYTEKIQIVNGVILVSWRQKVLERQIEYGAKLGHVVLSLARMELNNFYKHVMPVADYFDQRGMLYAVNGEREPALVYRDFRAAALRLLGVHDTTAPAAPTNSTPPAAPVTPPAVEAVPVYRAPAKGFPPVIWVIGGPGSNKAALCDKVVRAAAGWAHCSVGRLLRAAAEAPGNRNAEDAPQLRQAIAAGDMAPQMYVLQLVESQMRTHMSAQGIIMDGFPRDMKQVHEFESKFNQQPELVLLDCSKLQLGRGRLDDSVAAFRRRLELFREHTLPVLKTLDSEGRLAIVDGDTDTPPVQQEFHSLLMAKVEALRRTGGMIVPQLQPQQQTLFTDLEAQPEINSVSRIVHQQQQQQQQQLQQTQLPHQPHYQPHANGVVRPSRDTIRDMYAHVENYNGDVHL
ncbi:adenylate kinase isoenzyme 5 [Schistocerca piceifrons]|uniref:adenylate kinase isoenzyme 5 n=1 Tax=Schistocerca piceifrons TaxID=274613 RepID=UPI001F5F8C08|nr:adenylate kinase isoenzyme 5 [Schistocerca piceifrons]